MTDNHFLLIFTMVPARMTTHCKSSSEFIIFKYHAALWPRRGVDVNRTVLNELLSLWKEHVLITCFHVVWSSSARVCRDESGAYLETHNAISHSP